MGSPNLLFALLIGSVTVSAALKCRFYYNEHRGVVERDGRDYLCSRITSYCAFAKPDSGGFCTTEDITAGRNVTVVGPVLRSDYTVLIDSYCSSDPNVRLDAHRLADVASCDTDLCNDVESSMTIPTCDKPADPNADFYCNVATWADDSTINQSTDRTILYPPRNSYCYSAHITDKRTGKADWRAAYLGSSEVKRFGQNSVCKDNVFETDKLIIRSARVCQWSGCNDGKTGDLVTCQNAIQAAAGEAFTRSDGRGLLQLLDRNAARATDDARRVLRVLQSIASEASGAVPPSVPVSSSTAAPPAHAAGEASTRSEGRGLLQLLDRNAARATDDARRVLRMLQRIASEASGDDASFLP